MTTTPEGAAPKGAAPARGRHASSELVEVYKILTKAGEPLTIPQIAERMPKTGYASAAMQAYKTHLKEKQPGVWTALESLSRWPEETQHEAMVWWIRQIVRLGCQKEILKVTAKPVQNMYGTVREGTYAAGRPPKVLRTVWVEKTNELVDWSPDEETALNEGHTAGMEFMRRLEEVRGGKTRLTQREREMYELAEKAIRPRQ